MLSAFEKKRFEDIDTAIDSLRKIQAMGDDFDQAKIHLQHQKQGKNKRARTPYRLFNEIAISEDQYQQRLQRAIERSIKEYNKHNSGYDNTSEEYDHDEHQFAQDMKTAMELSLKDEFKNSKAHEMETHGDATTPAAKEGDLITIEKHVNDKTASSTTFKPEGLIKALTFGGSHPDWSSYDPLFATQKPLLNQSHLGTLVSHSTDDDIANKKATDETNLTSLLANLAFPTVSAPVRFRCNVPAILQAQEQEMIDVLQPQPSTPHISSCQIQPSYESPRQYRRQVEQQQKWQRQYQQERLPQPVKFTPCGDDYKITEAASISSSERNSPLIVPKSVTGFEGKPRKIKVFSDLPSLDALGRQPRVLEWDSSGVAIWDSFASSTDTKWKQGIDTEILDWENEQTKNQAEAPKLPKLVPTRGKSVVDANKDASCLIGPEETCICGDLISIEEEGEDEEDNWTKQEDRPDSMVIIIPNYPVRKSKGPRIFCPDDGDFESNDDDEKDSDEANR